MKQKVNKGFSIKEDIDQSNDDEIKQSQHDGYKLRSDEEYLPVDIIIVVRQHGLH